VGRSVGDEAIGAAASMEANCDCDSGHFIGGRSRRARTSCLNVWSATGQTVPIEKPASKASSQIIVALTPPTLNLFFTRALVFCRHGNGRIQATVRLALPAVRGISRSKAIHARLAERSDGSRVRVRLRPPVLEFGMDREASCYSAWLMNGGELLSRADAAVAGGFQKYRLGQC
jgi:hypothetical protein